jgi:O-methyltransferase
VAYGVPGDYGELGSFDGKTSVIFQKAIEGTTRRLLVFDHFEMGFHLTGRDIRRELESNFRIAGAGDLVIHAGDFANTVPQELPAQIAFVHIDCGFGGDSVKHAETVKSLLSHVYPRMPTGAIGVLMDFYDPTVNKGTDFNPGAGQAAREFFADKPEKVSALWADEYVHGYFRKK